VTPSSSPTDARTPPPGIGAVFLDRDGVINHDSPEFVKTPGEFFFLPKSLAALGRLGSARLPVVVITNQSGIGRGLIRPAALHRIHEKMIREAEKAGGYIQDIFACPHAPDEGCDCRKPKPGLLYRAFRAHGYDPRKTVMVGDSAKDIRAAYAAGCRYAVLVRTGNGIAAKRELTESGELPTAVCADLSAAVDWILTPRDIQPD
jgi:histidinol-phosphate phosphatase family protein